MKTSTRYVTATLLTILVLPVLVVVYSRFLAPPPGERPPPERTPAAELAALRDFTAIEVEGDFALEVTESAGYTLSYEPVSEFRGEFVARVENGTLHLRGFGNRNEVDGIAARVRIAGPALRSLDVSFSPSLTVRGLSVEEFDLRAVQVRAVTVADNTIGTLNIRSIANGPLELEGNTITTTEFSVAGGDSRITTRN